jgi:hypothetical protein
MDKSLLKKALLGVSLFICLGLMTNFVSTASAQDELFVSALVEGAKFTADKTGTYRFTIISGASELCPPESQPEHPEWWGWTTDTLVYKNRPIEWCQNPNWPYYLNPTNWDFRVGDSSFQPTYEEAEAIGKGMFVDVPLQENDYVILVAHDSKDCFDDNSGGVYFSIIENKGYNRKWIFLQGDWALYGTDLQEDHIWIGDITIDRFGNVIGGELNNPVSGDHYDITGGHFDLDIHTGKVTGAFNDSDGETMRVEATMNYSRDQISGVMGNVRGDEEGMFILVKMPMSRPKKGK